MLKLFTLVFSFLFFATETIQSQSVPENTVPPQRTCGTEIPPDEYEEWFSARVAEFVANQEASRSAAISYTIPVIIHIIHSGTAVGSGPNISLAQAQSQIAILNADFAGTNADISNVPSAFNGVKAGNTGIQFCLAKVDPNGAVLAEMGIERINRVSRGWSDPNTLSANNFQNYFNQTIKPASIWDPTKYLNVWVTPAGTSDLLGFASFPAGSGLSGLSGLETATTSGVVVNYTAWGNVGAATSPYNRGRTGTHEVGHWLGLRHIWGDGTCATDFCSDTPPAQQANYGCFNHPYNAGACSGNTAGEMFMNYMDYVNDACMYMFSLAQATRMQTAMANGTYRVGLNNSGKCNLPTALDASISAIVNPAAGSSGCLTTVTPIVTLRNVGSSTLTSCQIRYSYDGGTVSTFNWTGSLASGATTNVTLPVSPSLSVASHTFNVNTNLPNNGTDQNTANDANSSTFSVITPTLTALPFTQGFQGTTFVPTGWTLSNTNNDGTWTRTTTAGGFATSTACARMDSYSPSATNAGTVDEMRTPTFGFTGLATATMTFDVAYARYNATNIDSLIILASTDCGVTWTRVYNKGGSGLATAPDKTNAIFVPTASQWRTETINLNSFVGQSNIRFAIRSRAGYGQALYVDNINISGTTASLPASVSIAQTTGTSTICAGTSVTFTATPTNGGSAPTYQWKVNGANVATGVSFTTSTLTTGQIVTCVMTSNLAGVTASPATSNAITITVNAVPATPTATSNSPLCAGQTLNLSTSTLANATYAWSGPSSYSSTSQNPTRSNATTAMAGTYSLTKTVNGCTSLAGTVSVTVNAVPATPTPTSNSPVCVGSALNLSTSALTGATYSWIGPAAYSNTTQNPTRNNATTAMAGTYSLSTTVNGCSSAPATITVAVNPVPATPSLSNNGPLCAGSTLNLSTAAITNATYTWSGPASFTSSSQNPSISNTTTAMAGTYSLTVTVGGCASAAGIAAVVINSAPAAPVPSSNSPVCIGGTLNLSTATASGASYSWTGPNNFTSTQQNPNLGNASNSNAGTYTVSVSSGGCTVTGTTTVVTLTSATPSVLVTATPIGWVCVGDPITFTAAPTNGGASPSYNWKVNNASVSGNGPTFSSATLNDGDVVTCTLTSSVSCASPATVNGNNVTVAIANIPATPTISSSGNILVSSASAGNQWYLEGVAIAGATSQSYEATTPGNYTVQVTLNGCSSDISASLPFVFVFVNEMDKSNQLTIYPNPTAGLFTISVYKEGNANINLEIINVLGQKIMADQLIGVNGNYTKTIDIQNFASGIYSIKIGSEVSKVILNR